MSQHDLSIANQGFPAFRSDLNDALQSLGTNSSGATAPSTTFANQFWYDTANNQLKQRNEDNDAWIIVAEYNQTTDALIAIGGKTLPTGAIVGESDTQTLTNKTIGGSQLVNASVTSAKLDSNAQYMGFKNRIINGAMMIDQRNAGASVTPTNQQYLLDRWVAGLTQASKYSVQQNAGAVTPPAGFKNYLGVTSLSAYSVVSGDIFNIQQRIEGLNVSDLGWGTANASAVTLSFQVRSSLTGTFGGAVYNYNGTRSYPFTYTVSSANTWTTISITIAGDTSGTWLTDNGIGLFVSFGLGVGSTYSSTAGSWAGGYYVSATGATSVVGTNGATFYITGVQLEKGSTATSFDYRPYGTELALCQRYFRQYQTSQWFGSGYIAANSSTTAFINVPAGQPMRATPTLSCPSPTSVTIPGGYAVSSFSTVYADSAGCIGVYAVLGSGTAGQGIALYTNTTTISLSAEL